MSRGADAEHVDQRAAGVADGLEHLLEALPAVVFDDDAGAGREVGFDIGVRPAEIAGGHVQPAVVEAAGKRLALDQELDFEAGQQDLIEHPDGQLRLTDGETPHRVLAPVQGDTLDIRSKRPLYASRPRRVYDRVSMGCRPGHRRGVSARNRRMVGISLSAARTARRARAATAAQQATFRAGTELVSFGVTVTDKQGELPDRPHPRRLRGLRGRQEADDRVLRARRRATAAPELHVGLLFDTSGSMDADIKLSRSAAIKFLNTLSDAKDMTLVDFDTEVRVAKYGQLDFPRLVERIRAAQARRLHGDVRRARRVSRRRGGATRAARSSCCSPTAGTRAARSDSAMC